MIYISGQILQGTSFQEGYLGIERGLIVETGDGQPPERPVREGIIVPSFVNCHTHVGDADVSLDPSLTLEEMVAPPRGMKHRALAAMDQTSLDLSIARARALMRVSGTSHFIDFREGGVEGANSLTKLKGPPYPKVMARPKGMEYDHEEVSRLLSCADGVAVSSVSDWEVDELDSLVEHVRREGKPFAMHASEGRREDMGRILSLQPSFLVHLCAADDGDMRMVADAGVPVVVCPRSNLFMGMVPPLSRMLDAGIALALGTDNFMNSDGDMRSETEMMARLLRSQGRDGLQAIQAAFVESRKLLNLESELPLTEGKAADLVVYEGRGSSPACDLLFRSGNGASMVCIR